MEDEFEKIELYEDKGIGEIRINGNKIKSVTDYEIKRGIDTTKITLNMSIPTRDFKTIGIRPTYENAIKIDGIKVGKLISPSIRKKVN